jgi:membrane-bound lytic murein transglycosylase B
MMMAHDSTPNRPELSAASVEALRAALEEYLDRSAEIASLQPVLQRIAAEAREKKIHAEQLLVKLKDVWYGLAAIRDSHEAGQQNRQLQRIVSLCIREYYSTNR